MGVLWLLPVYRAQGALSGALGNSASGEPGWLAHLESAASGVFAGRGTSVALVLAVISFVIGLGPLLTKRSAVFLVAGIALSLDYWIFGQAFGQMLTGMGTDPNTGPLVILLALTIFPIRPAHAVTITDAEPAERLGQRNAPRRELAHLPG